MYFIGSGALLYQAVSYAYRSGYQIDGICLPYGDFVAKKLLRMGLNLFEANSPEHLLSIFTKLEEKVVFSINNKYLLSDSLLEKYPRVFNIHNGLVQNYRGISEVCLFAAICRGDNQYGATLHQLLPAQKVDAGPVVRQSCFAFSINETFEEALKKSLDNCQKLFELSLSGIIDGSLVPIAIEVAPKAYSYQDLKTIVATADPQRLANASKLGIYSGFFPKLRLGISQM